MNVLEIITKIVNERRERNAYPYCAPLLSVRALCNLSDTEFREEIKSLKRAKKIRIVETINSYSFYLNECT